MVRYGTQCVECVAAWCIGARGREDFEELVREKLVRGPPGTENGGTGEW